MSNGNIVYLLSALWAITYNLIDCRWIVSSLATALTTLFYFKNIHKIIGNEGQSTCSPLLIPVVWLYRTEKTASWCGYKCSDAVLRHWSCRTATQPLQSFTKSKVRCLYIDTWFFFNHHLTQNWRNIVIVLLLYSHLSITPPTRYL